MERVYSERREEEKNRWRRWLGYALGIVIESSAVVAVSLLALLVMFIIKIIVK
jgi:hypothetical protein